MTDPYFEIDAVSNSILKYFKISPMHYLYFKKNKPKPTDAMKFGSLVHWVTLEPDMVKEYALIFDEKSRPVPDKDYRTKANQEWKEQMFAEADLLQKQLVSKVDYDKAQRMRDKLYSYGPSKEILEASGNTFESQTLWSKSKTKCKGKVDIKNPYFLADLKTTRDASPTGFRQSIFGFDYYRQGPMYLDGDAKGKLNLSDSKEFLFIAIETDEPHGISIHRLSKEVIIHGYEEYCDLIDKFETCMATGLWQGYEFFTNVGAEGVFDVNLPKRLSGYDS